MRRALSVGAAALLLATAQVFFGAPAQSQVPVTCAKVNPRTGECLIKVTTPGAAPIVGHPKHATAIGARTRIAGIFTSPASASDIAPPRAIHHLPVWA